VSGSYNALIAQEAEAQGVPPSIALAVAQTESGVTQFTPGGQVLTSSAGALGIFQLEPATAAGLGVDPTDELENIQGGIAYLAQLYQQYGNWTQALAAYNWGPGNVNNNASIPGSVMSYVNKVLGLAGISGATPAPSTASLAPEFVDESASEDLAPVQDNSGLWILGGIAALIGVGFWWLSD
jgi:Transglycosylase SLT domain